MKEEISKLIGRIVEKAEILNSQYKPRTVIKYNRDHGHFTITLFEKNHYIGLEKYNTIDRLRTILTKVEGYLGEEESKGVFKPWSNVKTISNKDGSIRFVKIKDKCEKCNYDLDEFGECLCASLNKLGINNSASSSEEKEECEKVCGMYPIDGGECVKCGKEL